MSTFTNKVDQKGRVSVPAPFRTALAGQTFNGIVVYRSFRLEALEGCGIDRMTEMAESLDELPQFSAEYEAFSSLFAEANQLPFDGEGRVMLPKALMDFAHIGDNLSFVGNGQTFQIWDPKSFEAHQQAMRERAVSSGLTMPPRRRPVSP
jgi:MraZ protein